MLTKIELRKYLDGYCNGVEDESKKLIKYIINAEDLISVEIIEADRKYAYEYMLSVAEKSPNKYAQAFLASCYCRGYFVKQDYVEGLKWSTLAAKQNSPVGLYYCGYIYRRGGFGIKQNHDEALKYYIKGAKLDYPPAVFAVGYIYHYIKKDYKTAEKWYRKAAELNEPWAQMNLGYMYRAGLVGKVDYKEAMLWYRKSAAQLNIFAQSGIGMLFQEGHGVAKNIPQAIYWFCLAAAQSQRPDDPQCKANEYLAALEKQGYGPMIAQQQQAILLEKKQKQMIELQRIQADQQSASSSTSSPAAPSVNDQPLQDLNIDAKTLVSIKLLGEGAFGKVYRGTWNGTEVAIKELQINNLPEQEKQEFKNEAEVMAKLRFPRIVQLFGICLDQPLRLVMEYMPLGSLYNVLRDLQRKLDWPQRISVATDTAEGLSHLHDRNPVILHRDLKSLNVLLDVNFRAKLTDFGLAQIKRTTSTTSTNVNPSAAVGTTRWMAPELFSTVPQYSTASDVFAFGILLWEIASRKIPFSDVANSNSVSVLIKEGKRGEIPPETPPKFSALMQRCWDSRRENRPAMRQALDELNEMKKATIVSGEAVISSSVLPNVSSSTTSSLGSLGSFGVKGNLSSANAATNSGNIQTFIPRDNLDSAAKSESAQWSVTRPSQQKK